jgi:serine protease Do
MRSLLGKAALLAIGSGVGALIGMYSGGPQGSRSTEAFGQAPGVAQAPAGSSGATGPSDVNIYIGLSKKVVPSVVNISTYSRVKSPFSQGAPDDLFRRFFEDFFRQHGGGGGGGPRGREEDDGEGPDGPPGGGPRAMSLGTGFIIDASGLILTNNHVVAEADQIEIRFTEDEEEKPVNGEVVGRDPEIDVALIKVKGKKELVPLALGDSDSVQVGEYVAAVGNPFGHGHTVSHGIISAKNRHAPDFPLARYLQTDAPINPGNSGGPLVNLKGEVIGINNAIDQRAVGIGFAIPVNLVKAVLSQLRTKGTVARGYIGVLVHELTPDIASKVGVSKDTKAPFITHVYPGEPADKAGLKPYDVVLEFNRKPVKTAAELITGVTAVNVGDSVPIKVLRAGKTLDLTIKVTQRPGSQPQEKKKPEKGKGRKPTKMNVGMSLEDLTPEVARELDVPDTTRGAVVGSIAYDGPADQAGLLRGDIIIEVDRKPIKDVDDFFGIVKEKKTYLLRVRRTDPRGNEAFTVVVLDLKDPPKKDEE